MRGEIELGVGFPYLEVLDDDLLCAPIFECLKKPT